MIKITKIFTFEMAHALSGYDGPCANIHGHSYKFEVCVTGIPINDENNPKNGMLIDYGDLKKIVNDCVISCMDHALVLKDTTDQKLVTELRKHYKNVMLMPYQPTNENLLLDFAKRVEAKLPGNVKLYSMRLYETETSFAEWISVN